MSSRAMPGHHDPAPSHDEKNHPSIEGGGTIGTREIVFVCLLFLLSRLLIFSAMAVSDQFVSPPTGRRAWNLENPLLRPLFRWDAGWYLSVAQKGYSYNGNPRQQQNINFFPLYPLTCRLCRAITGLSIPLCAFLLSNLAFFVGLTAFYALATREIGSEGARSATLLLAFFPGSFFFSTMYTESFFLAFSVLAFSAFRKQQFILGGMWAGLGTATRVTGVLLFVPLLFEAFSCRKDRRIWWRVILAGLLTASGIGTFMVWQWVAFGDPLAFSRVQQQAWGSQFSSPFGAVRAAFEQIFSAHFSPQPYNAIFGLMFIVLGCALTRRLPWSYSVYTLLGVLLPLFTTKVNSLTRYINVLFPGFMALGIIGRESRWLPWVLLALFTLVLTIFSMRFAQWHWIP